jgi:hypothetical protein
MNYCKWGVTSLKFQNYTFSSRTTALDHLYGPYPSHDTLQASLAQPELTFQSLAFSLPTTRLKIKKFCMVLTLC